MLDQFLGYKFKDKTLLETALTHRSFGNFHDIANNERLEFLGDAVLQLCITSILLESFDEKDEGDLSKYRSLLVQSRTLSKKSKQSGRGYAPAESTMAPHHRKPEEASRVCY